MARTAYISYIRTVLAAVALVLASPAGHAATGAPDGVRPAAFAWGAEINGGVEMGGHNISTIGAGASFGMQWQWVRFAGIGAEADIAVNNSSRLYPIALIFRTDFARSRRLLYMDARGGVALSYVSGYRQTTQPYGSLGLGITLAAGRTYASALTIGCSYVGRDTCFKGDTERSCPGMFYVTMRLGVSF